MPPGNVVNFQACCLIKDLGKKFFYSKRGWANSVFVPSVHHSSNNLDFRLKRHRFQVLFSKKPHRVKFLHMCKLHFKTCYVLSHSYFTKICFHWFSVCCRLFFSYPAFLCITLSTTELYYSIKKPA